jgi:hypothetical protein
MWISRKWKEEIEQTVRLMEKTNQDQYKRLRQIEENYTNLLNHLELTEWTEAPKDAIPAKTILITKKEQKKRNKNKQQSYIDPRVLQARQYQNCLSGLQQENDILHQIRNKVIYGSHINPFR